MVKKLIKKRGGKTMTTAVLHIVTKESKQKQGRRDPNWPNHIPEPTDDDLEFLSQLSKREANSSFFDKKKR
jgi:hypothetical protein